jgi:uncharacterized membrane protein (DUF485 family)
MVRGVVTRTGVQRRTSAERLVGAAALPGAYGRTGDDAVSSTGERSTGTVYEQVQASAEFAQLRSRLRRFIFPMSAAFLAWYLLYVVLASYAPDFMAIRLGDSNINVGLIIGLLQFVSTFAITTVYVRFANKHIDPAADKLRERIEGAE